MKMSGEPRSCGQPRVVVHVLVVARRDRGRHDQRAGQRDGERRELVADVHVVVAQRCGPGAHGVVVMLVPPRALGRAGRASRSRRRACPRSACPTGSSGGRDSRCRRPCRRGGAGCCARRAGRPPTPTTSRRARRAWRRGRRSSFHAACISVTRIASVSMYASAALSCDALERRQRLAELLALRRVLGGLRGRAPPHTPTCDRARARAARGRASTPSRAPPPSSPSGSAGCAVERQVARPSSGRSCRRRSLARRAPAGRRGTRRARRRRSTRARARVRRRGPRAPTASRRRAASVSPSRVARDLGVQWVVDAGLGEGGASRNDLARATPGSQRSLLLVGAELGDRQRAEHEGRPSTGRAPRARPCCSSSRHDLDRARGRSPPMLLGQRDGEQVRVGERAATGRGRRAPRCASTSFTRSAVAVALEDLLRQVADGDPAPRRA